jgi:putative membrane protein
MHWMHGGWNMGFMWLWVVLLIVAVAALVYYLGQGGHTPGRGPGESAEEILKQRYARGEIDKNEFERRLGDLRR